MKENSPYSYRADPRVPSFDDTAPLLIFDGVCVLCSSGVQWMLKRDPEGETKFAAIQDEIPRALYAHYGLDADQFDTFMVLSDGRPHLRWAGAIAAARTLPAPWSWLAVLGRLTPDFIGDALYNVIQRNRLRWFGRRSDCMVPTEKTAGRFLGRAEHPGRLPVQAAAD